MYIYWIKRLCLSSLSVHTAGARTCGYIILTKGASAALRVFSTLYDHKILKGSEQWPHVRSMRY